MSLLGLVSVHPLATINAMLNALATVLLVAGWVFIARGNWRAHRAAMVAAFAVSAVFLACYLTYHWLVGHVPFRGQGTARAVYFTILISHIVLAVVQVPLILRTVYLGLKDRRAQHRKWAKVTTPIWLYVSVTGVVVYWLLYHY